MPKLLVFDLVEVPHLLPLIDLFIRQLALIL